MRSMQVSISLFLLGILLFSGIGYSQDEEPPVEEPPVEEPPERPSMFTEHRFAVNPSRSRQLGESCAVDGPKVSRSPIVDGLSRSEFASHNPT